METIVAALPNLNMQELKTLRKKIISLLYFDHKENYPEGLPSNATTLMTDGTIKVLEAVDDEDAWLSDEEGLAKLIKMKIKGIDDTVYLNFVQHNGRHTFTLYLSIKIGDEKYEIGYGDCVYDHGKLVNGKLVDTSDTVLKQLHEALEIPKYETEEMFYLLFYPYCSIELLNKEIKALENKPPQPPSPKKKRSK